MANNTKRKVKSLSNNADAVGRWVPNEGSTISGYLQRAFDYDYRVGKTVTKCTMLIVEVDTTVEVSNQDGEVLEANAGEAVLVAVTAQLKPLLDYVEQKAWFTATCLGQRELSDGRKFWRFDVGVEDAG